MSFLSYDNRLTGAHTNQPAKKSDFRIQGIPKHVDTVKSQFKLKKNWAKNSTFPIIRNRK